MKFRKKPVVIEAVEWDGMLGTIPKIQAINKLKRKIKIKGGQLFIDTLEGTHEAKVGDMVIQGVNGEIYPCKPDIFKKTYEPVK